MEKSIHVTGVVSKCHYCGNLDHMNIHMELGCSGEFDIKPIVYFTCSKCSRQNIMNIAVAQNEYEEEFSNIIQKYSETTHQFDFDNAGMCLTDRRCFGITFPKEIYERLKYTIPEGWQFIPHEDTYLIGPVLPMVDPIGCNMYKELLDWAKEYFKTE